MKPTMEKKMLYSWFESPLGELLLTGDTQSLFGVYLSNQKHTPVIGQHWVRNDNAFSRAVIQLNEYFLGQRRQFDVPMDAEGTEFQKRVWKSLCQIPYGKTCGYGELARELGNPNASRAVGMANGCNPISIIVPCHRVIGANGALTGYGGGLTAKKWLLDHEAAHMR
jgi:methylated-DNA-[protein]-cysteine S-methyltransferase